MAIAPVTGGDNRYWHMVSTSFNIRNWSYAHQSSSPLYHFTFFIMSLILLRVCLRVLFVSVEIISTQIITIQVISNQDLTQAEGVTTFRTKL